MRVVLSFVAVLCAVVVACAPAKEPPPGADAGTELAPAPRLQLGAARTSAVVDEAGGELTLTTAAGTWRLVVPADSLDGPIELSMREATAPTLPALRTVELLPSGTRFARGAVLAFSGLDEPAPALSFEPGRRGVDLTYASVDGAGVRFVLLHFSAAGLLPSSEVADAADALAALTPEQREELEAFVEAADDEETQQAIALGEEFRRSVQAHLDAADDSVPALQAALTAHQSWSRRVQDAALANACDGVRCSIMGSCRSDDTCAGRCEGGQCVQTLATLIGRGEAQLLDAALALHDAMTAPRCEDASGKGSLTPADWVEVPAQVRSIIELLGGMSKGAPCASAAVLLDGPGALGDDVAFTVSAQARVTTPAGPADVPASFSLTAVGADVADDTLRSDDGAAVQFTLQRDTDVSSVRVDVSATLAAPFDKLDVPSAQLQLNRSPLDVELEATPAALSEAAATSEICVRVRSDGADVPAWNVTDVALEGPGSVVADSLGTVSGGEVCGITFTAPTPLPESAVTSTLTVTVRTEDGQVQSATVEIALDAAALQMAVAASSTSVTLPGEAVTVCAAFSDGDVDIGSYELAWSLEGPGQLEQLAQTVIDAPGPVCQSYTAPSPLPEAGGTVRIHAVGTTASGQASGSVTLTFLDGGEADLRYTGTTAGVTSSGGSLSLSFDVTLHVTPTTLQVTNAVVTSATYSSVSGVAAPDCDNFTVVELSATCTDQSIPFDDTALPRDAAFSLGALLTGTRVTRFRSDGNPELLCMIQEEVADFEIGAGVGLVLDGTTLRSSLRDPEDGVSVIHESSFSPLSGG